MDFKMVLGMILFIYLSGLIFLIWLITGVIMPYKEEKIKLKEMEIKNDKYKLFCTIDANRSREYVDDYIEEYIHRYIAFKFIANKIMHIKESDINAMVRDLTKLIVMEISELYIFHINNIKAIDSDEDLVAYIHERVMNITVEQVTSYNSSMT